jgi:molybdenum cofactor guanylyltransferase
MTIERDELIGVVLAGGASRRMGTDKAELSFDGVPLLVRTIELLHQVTPVVVSVGHAQRRMALYDKTTNPHKAKPTSVPGGNNLFEIGTTKTHFIDDRFPDEGPLGGIATVAERFPKSDLLVVSCDLPFLSLSALTSLVDSVNMASGGSPRVPIEAWMIASDDRLQPLLALYRRTAVRRMQAAFEQGERSILRVPLSVAPVHLRADDRSSLDVDTPEDMERVRSFEPPE